MNRQRAAFAGLIGLSVAAVGAVLVWSACATRIDERDSRAIARIEKCFDAKRIQDVRDVQSWSIAYAAAQACLLENATESDYEELVAAYAPGKGRARLGELSAPLRVVLWEALVTRLIADHRKVLVARLLTHACRDRIAESPLEFELAGAGLLEALFVAYNNATEEGRPCILLMISRAFRHSVPKGDGSDGWVSKCRGWFAENGERKVDEEYPVSFGADGMPGRELLRKE